MSRNTTGDSQLLCELFSGERVSYRYASEKNQRHWLQCSLFYRRSDTGSVCCPSNRQDGPRTWLTRPILVHLPHLPPAFPPGHRGGSVLWLESQPLESLTDVFLEMFEYYGQRKVVYKFTDSAQSLLNDMQAIKQGNPPPKCKKMDLIKRLAGSLHIFNHIASKLLEGIQPGPPPQRITEHSVAAAEKLTAFGASQKQIATEVRILSM